MTYQRKEVIGDCTLYLADCLDLLPTLGEVDAIITDPPYSAHTHGMAKTNKGKGHGTRLVDFEALTDEQFASVVDTWLGASCGWVVATCDYRHAFPLVERGEFVRLGAWVKPNPMPQISGDRPGQGFELIAILHSGRTQKQWNRGGGAGVWTVPVQREAEVSTQKPERLLSLLVSDFTQPGETVCDPFMGSATTGVACAKQGRAFIGIELDEDRFDIACERIRTAHAQPDMFVESSA